MPIREERAWEFVKDLMAWKFVKDSMLSCGMEICQGSGREM